MFNQWVSFLSWRVWGLGLAIAAKLLALHESKIRVTSELGKGTKFEFSLPAS